MPYGVLFSRSKAAAPTDSVKAYGRCQGIIRVADRSLTGPDVVTCEDMTVKQRAAL